MMTTTTMVQAGALGAGVSVGGVSASLSLGGGSGGGLDANANVSLGGGQSGGQSGGLGVDADVSLGGSGGGSGAGLGVDTQISLGGSGGGSGGGTGGGIDVGIDIGTGPGTGPVVGPVTPLLPRLFADPEIEVARSLNVPTMIDMSRLLVGASVMSSDNKYLGEVIGAQGKSAAIMISIALNPELDSPVARVSVRLDRMPREPGLIRLKTSRSAFVRSLRQTGS